MAIFCQQCGAENVDAARFCNQCGSSIAKAGEPGGPVATSTSGSKSRGDISTVSLSSVGVRSPVSAWLVLIAVAAFLMGLGALAAWVAVRSNDEDAEVADNGPPEPDEVELGDPIPSGADVPDVDFVPSAPRRRTPTASRRSTTSRTPTAGGRGSRSARAESSSAGRSSSSAGSASSGSGGSGGDGSDSSSSGEGQGAEPDEERGGAGEEDNRQRGPPEVSPELRDFEMEAYVTRLRRYIRTYRLPQAQVCFEHETRNNRQVRGTVVVAFEILADGNIRNARVARNTTGLDTLGRCLANRVDRWQVPRPPEAPLAMELPFSR